ncbi:MAG: bifunctional lytic transglycosylase/C40 family peptidase [Acidimicrobiaceae bacterium]|nr:bifunctional lytic transglycosylase/C40 family peptidase [Acidimicrobiaceae bacterium]
MKKLLGGLAGSLAVVVFVPLVVGVGQPAEARNAAAPATVAGIPAAYLAAFEASGVRFGVPWPVLAGIYRVECDFGQSDLPGCRRGTENAAGAQGPGQFLPGTWRRGLAPHEIIPVGPPTAGNDDGFATDGDGDGIADPWDVADAVASTARMLQADGAANDASGAVFAYNHDPAYVQHVLSLAASYRAASPASPPAPVSTELAFAAAQLGKPYRWGGGGPQSFDCSGLVQAALGAAGLPLPHNAAAQYADTATDGVALWALAPGDLVFYGTSAPTIHHVGIAIGGDDMIDAPFTGADVRVDPIAAADLFAATRPLPPS